MSFCSLLGACTSKDSFSQVEKPRLSAAEQAKVDAEHTEFFIGNWTDSNQARIYHNGVPVKVVSKGNRHFFDDHTALSKGELTISSLPTGSMSFLYEIKSNWEIRGGYLHDTVFSFDCKPLRFTNAHAVRTFVQFTRASIGQTSTFRPLSVKEGRIVLKHQTTEVILFLHRIP